MSYFPVIQMLKWAYSGSLCLGGKVNKQMFVWRVTSHKAVSFLEDVLPYLSVKKEGALIAIEYMSVVSDGRGRFAQLTEEELGVREVFRLKLAHAKEA